MGIAIPQVVTEDRASSAPIVDGSLRFNGVNQYLRKAFKKTGHQSIFTWSCWVKRNELDTWQRIFTCEPGSNLIGGFSFRDPDSKIRLQQQGFSANNHLLTTASYRDTSAWYHIVMRVDTFHATAADRFRVYINGERQDHTWDVGGNPAQGSQLYYNTTSNYHEIGHSTQYNAYQKGQMTQCYWLDGQSLGPEHFAFTDPLTGTWRPKEYVKGAFEELDKFHTYTWAEPQNALKYQGINFLSSSGGTVAWKATGASNTGLNLYTSTDNSTWTRRLTNQTVDSTNGLVYESSDQYVILVNGTDTTWSNQLQMFSDVNGAKIHYSNSTYPGNGSTTMSWSGPTYTDGTIGSYNSFYIPMDGSKPIGEDQAPSVNDGTIWSDYASADGITAGNVAGFFQGDNSNCSSLSLSTSGTFLLTKDIPNVYSIGVHSNTGAAFTMKVNEGLSDAYTVTVPSQNNVNILDTFTGFNGTIHTLSFSGFGAGTCLNALEINGVFLVDGEIGNSFTPIFFGSSAASDQANGAKPILNTSGGTATRPGVLGSEVSSNYTVTVESVDGQSKYAINGVDRPNPTLYRGGTYTFDYTAASGHPLYLSSLPDGKHNSKARSVSFNGSSQSLSISGSSDYYIGTGDFTIEGFVWSSDPSANGVYNRIFCIDGPSGDTSGNLQINVDSSAGNLIVWSGGGNIATGSRNICDSKWHHFAVTRAGRALKIFFDGIEEVSVTNTDNWGNFESGQPRPEIGARSNSSGWFDGYISNVRLTVGQSLYISDFTPPTTTLTTTSQGADASKVKLICCQDVASTTAAKIASGGTITANGSAPTVNAYNPFLYNNFHGNFGLNLATSNTTKITIPHYAADVLYYYCNQHPNMGNTTAMSVVTDAEKADPYAWKCVLAQPLTSIKEDVSNQINCTSTEKAISATAATNSTFYNLYGASTYMDGNGLISTPDNDDFDFGIGDFTVEIWARANATSGDQYIVSWENPTGGTRPNAGHAGINIYNGNWRIGGFNQYLVGGNTGLQSETWMHIAMSRVSGTLRVFVNGTLIGSVNATGVQFSCSSNFTLGKYAGAAGHRFVGYLQDLRVYKGVGKYINNFTPASRDPDVIPDSPSGIATKSKVAKVTNGSVSLNRSPSAYLTLPDHADLAPGNGDFTIETFLYANSFDNYPVIWDTRTGSSDTTGFFFGLRDTGKIYLFDNSATRIEYDFLSLKRWHHVALVRKSNVFKMYVDGVQRGTTYTRNHDFTNRVERIGDTTNSEVQTWEFNGFFSNYRFTKGQALYDGNFSVPTQPLTATSQGATGSNVKLLACQSPTSVTAATIIPTGSIGTNGSPTATTFNPFTDDINAIRGQVSNYATFNPLQKNGGVTLSKGNLKLQTVSNVWKATQTTIGMKTGKFYWEFGPRLWRDNNNHCQPGVAAMGLGNAYEMGGTNYSAFYHYTGTTFFNGQGGAGTAFGQAWNDTEFNIIGIAFDADTRKVWFSRNGVWQGGGNPSAGTNEAGIINLYGDGTYAPTLGSYGSLNGGGADANFGQKPFRYTPPDGFQPISISSTMPDDVISRSDQYFGAVTYTGNGSTQSISGLKFNAKPDFVWIKQRSTPDQNHALFDSIRGPGHNLSSSTNHAERSDHSGATGDLTSFDVNGFSLGSSAASGARPVNLSGKDIVAWCWKAGGSAGTFNIDDVGYASAAAAGLDGGTITPTGASVGTKQGFSIIGYTGTGNNGTLSHGLSQPPEFMILKGRNFDDNWRVYHKDLDATAPASYYLMLESTNGKSSLSTNIFNQTMPTSSVFSLGTDSAVNGDTRTMISYLWHSVPGLQKFGKYTGNLNADGPFIELGFRPALVWLKEIGNAGYWNIYDNKRNTSNLTDRILWANDDYQENDTDIIGSAGSNAIDFLSNGFKLRSNKTGTNRSGGNYIYCAWAASPFSNLYGAQSNAR